MNEEPFRAKNWAWLKNDLDPANTPDNYHKGRELIAAWCEAVPLLNLRQRCRQPNASTRANSATKKSIFRCRQLGAFIDVGRSPRQSMIGVYQCTLAPEVTHRPVMPEGDQVRAIATRKVDFARWVSCR
jgi:hypothetical protein